MSLGSAPGAAQIGSILVEPAEEIGKMLHAIMVLTAVISIGAVSFCAAFTFYIQGWSDLFASTDSVAA